MIGGDAALLLIREVDKRFGGVINIMTGADMGRMGKARPGIWSQLAGSFAEMVLIDHIRLRHMG